MAFDVWNYKTKAYVKLLLEILDVYFTNIILIQAANLRSRNHLDIVLSPSVVNCTYMYHFYSLIAQQIWIYSEINQRRTRNPRHLHGPTSCTNSGRARLGSRYQHGDVNIL